MKMISRSAFAAALFVSMTAQADVQGYEMQVRDTVTYTFNYSSDSGYADIFDCTIVVKNKENQEVFRTVVNLHENRIRCGDAGRNQSVSYLYRTDVDSPYCYQKISGSQLVPAKDEYCGL